MTVRTKFLSALVLFLPAMLFAANFIYQPVLITPPNPPREFRGAWIATVGNIDWPSKPGLAVAEQKTELLSLLDRAVQLHLNAIIFQIRPVCDALYSSPIEPWSEYLTGVMGRPPQPFYDPLAFAIGEAHKRGLELHAWFNPFRALRSQSKSLVAWNHISQTHPELVRKYGAQLWLDPGEPAAREYVLRVVMDVVKRYDVDGVAFDDQLLYPYQEKDAAGHVLNFPDDASWQKYGLRSGLSRNDWRRANGDEFIRNVYLSIKAVKPWVKFGISPFGIWRPGFPQQIKGLDAYNSLYADSRLWLANGWLDYLAPQLYWPVDAPQQSFSVLLNWWSSQNVKGRHLWPGLDAAGVGEKFTADEIALQIQITRAQAGADGEIFYHLRTLAENPALANILGAKNVQTALVPASPWLDSVPPDKPMLNVTIGKNSSVTASWKVGGEPAWLWVLQFRTNEVWTTQILPAHQTDYLFENLAPNAISIRAVDRVGNLSAPTVLSPQSPQKTSPLIPDRRRPDLDWPPKG
jgi:uncharacterized lipoprotein YddW (UPF0748 family)